MVRGVCHLPFVLTALLIVPLTGAAGEGAADEVTLEGLLAAADRRQMSLWQRVARMTRGARMS